MTVVECLALLHLLVQIIVAWVRRGRVDFLVPGTQMSPRRLDPLLPEVGHDGVISLEGAVVAVALERCLDRTTRATPLDYRHPALLAQGRASPSAAALPAIRAVGIVGAKKRRRLLTRQLEPSPSHLTNCPKE